MFMHLNQGKIDIRRISSNILVNKATAVNKN